MKKYHFKIIQKAEKLNEKNWRYQNQKLSLIKIS